MKTWWPTPWISWNPHHWCLWVILELTVRFHFACKLIPLVWSVAAASVECSAPVKKLGVLVHIFHCSCMMIAWLNLIIEAWWGCDNLSAEWCDTIIVYVSWVLANMMTESPITSRTCDRNLGHRFCIMVLPKFWVDYCILAYTRLCELMKSRGSHWQLVTAICDELMVWHFVSNSHKVMTALVVMCPSNCRCGDISAIS
jgi:hypothetical protein